MGKILFLKPETFQPKKNSESRERSYRREEPLPDEIALESSMVMAEAASDEQTSEEFFARPKEEAKIKEQAQNLILEAAFLLQNYAEDNDRTESRVAWLLEDCAQILMERSHLQLVDNQNYANQSESEL